MYMNIKCDTNASNATTLGVSHPHNQLGLRLNLPYPTQPHGHRSLNTNDMPMHTYNPMKHTYNFAKPPSVGAIPYLNIL